MRRVNLLVPLAALLLGACQAPGPGPRGDSVALVRDAMVQSARDARGPTDASAAAAAVGGLRGDAGGGGESAGGVVGALLGG